MMFFWCKFGFGKCFGASSLSNHWAGHRWLLNKIHFLLYVTVRLRNDSLLCRIREDDVSKWCFWFVVSSWGHPLVKLFHLSNLLLMLTSHRKVNIELFSNFSSSCKRIGFDDGSQLVIVNSRWPPLHSSSSRLGLLCRTSRATTALDRRHQLLGQVRCWWCELSPLLYNPFWTWIRKSLKFAFLSNIISIVYI